MSNLGKRLDGVAEELGGKIEKVVGQAIGSEAIKAEGLKSEHKGQEMQKEALAEKKEDHPASKK